MPHLIEVAFKGNRKEFFLWESDDPPPRAVAVIVDADRGEDLGRVHAVGAEAEHRSAKVPHGLFGASPARVAKRLASPDEMDRHGDVRAADDEARRKATERVKANALVMKITDAEWQWDRKKLTFYFTAEKRVDFRTLVRELASMFRTRIELKQIGVRDEAKRLDGVGRCGRQYCSASWLPELRPVNLGVAKDQRLSLNPSQISGACGRLMCCLRYEHEFYVESRRKYPKEGKTLHTSRGEEKVIANDIFRERVNLRGADGESRTIPLADLRDEMTVAGDALAGALEAAARETHPVRSSVEHVALRSAAAGLLPDERASVSTPAPLGAADATSVPSSSTLAPDTVEPPEEGEGGEGGEALDGPLAAEGPRRTPRRRGRRGGRRNRPSGGIRLPVLPPEGDGNDAAGGDGGEDGDGAASGA